MAEEASVEQEESSLTQRLAERVAKLKYVMLAFVVVVIAIVGGLSWQRHSAEQKIKAAQDDLYRSVYSLMEKPDTDAVAMFDALAVKYKGTSAGADALVFKFGSAFNAGKFAEAEAAARDLIAAYPTHAFVPRARLSMAQAQAQQGRTAEAVATLRTVLATPAPDIMPEAKLALAEALEAEAAKAEQGSDQQRRLLAEAENEYNDIIVRSRITVPEQRGFWPQAVTAPADFQLVTIKDVLAGYEHKSPRIAAPAAPEAVSAADLESAAAAMAASQPEPEEKTEAKEETLPSENKKE